MANTVQVSSCCGCCSARTGTIIIGILQIILSISVLVLIIIALNGKVVVIDVSKIMIIFICFCITTFITILLLVGVFKRNTCMMLPWLVLEVIAAVILLIKTIGVSSSGTALITCLIHLMLLTYFWLVVYSHYQELKNDRTGSRICLHEGSHNYISKLEVGQN